MNIREKNAQYDEDVGDLYDKCAWCEKVILGRKFEIHQDNKLFYLCSQHCKSVMLYSLRTVHISSEDVKSEELKYNRLKSLMTDKYEEIKRRRGY